MPLAATGDVGGDGEGDGDVCSGDSLTLRSSSFDGKSRLTSRAPDDASMELALTTGREPEKLDGVESDFRAPALAFAVFSDAAALSLMAASRLRKKFSLPGLFAAV